MVAYETKTMHRSPQQLDGSALLLYYGWCWANGQLGAGTGGSAGPILAYNGGCDAMLVRPWLPICGCQEVLSYGLVLVQLDHDLHSTSLLLVKIVNISSLLH